MLLEWLTPLLEWLGIGFNSLLLLAIFLVLFLKD